MSERTLRINLIFGALQKVTPALQAMGMGSKKLANELKASTDQLDRLNKTQANISGFRKLKSELVQTGQELTAARLRVAALSREFAGAEKPSRKLTRELASAKKEAGDLKAKLGEQQLGLQKLRTALNDAGVGTTGLSGHQARLRADIARTTGEIDQQKAKLGALKDREDRFEQGRTRIGQQQALGGQIAVGGASAVGAGLALGAPLIAASKQAMTFESRMIDVQKVMNDVSPAQIKVIEKGLLEMSNRVPIAAEGLGQIAAEGARAGIAVKDLLGFTEGAAKMATAFDISAEEAGAMQAKWQTGLGLTIPQITLLGDKVNALTNKFGGAAVSVTEMITRVGPLGKIAGVQSGEMAALAQLLTKVGVESEIGATGIKRLMLTLNVGEAATRSQSAAYKRLGLDAVEMAKKMQVDARGGILSVLDALNKLPKDQQAGVLTELFGSESVAAIAPMLSSLEQLKMNFELVGNEANYAGSMNREFGVAMSKTENQVKLAANAVGTTGTTLGTQLLPHIREGAGWIRTIAMRTSEWAAEHPTLTKYLGIGLGLLSSVLVVVGALAIGVGAVLGPFALLRYSLMLAAPALGLFTGALGLAKVAFWKLTAAIFANPILAIIGTIAVAAFLIYKHWDTIGPYFSKLWGGIKSVFFGAWEGIKGMMSGWASSALGVGASIIGAIGSGIRNGASAVWDALKSAVFGGISKVRQWLGLGGGGGEGTPKPAIRTVPMRSGPKLAGARARGGPVFRGLSYLVGEEGEEIFTPDRDGQIIPNDRLRKGAARSFVTGSAIAALAATPAYASQPRPAAVPGGQGDKYTIIVNAKNAGSPGEIAAAVRREIEAIEREREARSRSSYRDDD